MLPNALEEASTFGRLTSMSAGDALCWAKSPAPFECFVPGLAVSPGSPGLLVGFFLLFRVLVDDLLRQVLRHLFVVRKLHRERAAAAGQ